ncbi:methyltransferase domain-containing protein [Thelonectria olida]|uniref:Methyltransferase domain-containing protein n=1 Tax=Thelonectria olida TaxID=1576542 RepID=A0A9P8VS65_9HYPO|nr:methyltransferase domain-containing protein [Thelonectria olida]
MDPANEFSTPIVTLAEWMGSKAPPNTPRPAVVVIPGAGGGTGSRANNSGHHGRYDSGCEMDDEENSDLVTISSEVTNIIWENGRRYHSYKEGRYPFPNDPLEQEREEILHHLFEKLLGGRLHMTSLDNPQTILDLGTGVGRWAVCMGYLYEDAVITGLDLSPIQDRYIPPNVGFVIDDIEDTWVDPPGSLDFVFCRNMSTSIRDWKRLFRQAYNAVSPGGWIEVQDLHWAFRCDDGTMPADWAPSILIDKIREGLRAMGIEMFAPTMHVHHAEAVGFTNLNATARRIPVGAWARDSELKDIGRLVRDVLCVGLHGMAIGPLTRGLGWSPERVQLFLVQVREGLMDHSVHACIYFHCLSAQKRLGSN